MAIISPVADQTITVAVGDPHLPTVSGMVADIAALLPAHVGIIGSRIDIHYSDGRTGEWKGEPEHSAHVTIYPAFPVTDSLRAALANVARYSGQESIAIWAAPAEMIEAAAPSPDSNLTLTDLAAEFGAEIHHLAAFLDLAADYDETAPLYEFEVRHIRDVWHSVP